MRRGHPLAGAWAQRGPTGRFPHADAPASHPPACFPDSRPTARASVQEPAIHVSLGDLLPLLALAKRHQYTWLHDFLDDEVAITPDLYDVLCAFSDHRRPSA